jgi:hypothetical protein
MSDTEQGQENKDKLPSALTGGVGTKGTPADQDQPKGEVSWNACLLLITKC